MELALTVSMRTVSRYLASRKRKPALERAAMAHEAGFRRLFLSAVRKAQKSLADDASTLDFDDAVTVMVHALTGGVDAPLPAFDGTRLRIAAGRKTLETLTSGAMVAGAGATEVCVLDVIPKTPTDEYVTNLRSSLKKQSATDKRDIVFSLGYRETRDEVFALAQYIEKRAGREAMLEALSSGTAWNTNYAVASKEWLGAQHLGANAVASKTTKYALKGNALNAAEKAAFEARAKAVQSFVREEYGDTIQLYRGVKKQAGDLGVGDEVELDVYGLSSWSTLRSTASNFAGKSGRVIKIEVKASDVFWTDDLSPARIINFSDDRGELVILTKGKSRKGVVVQ